MDKLFKLKSCEECKGTGDAHHQGHDYDCPDCLGTSYEEPAKRIMNLELMLKQHKQALKSSDTHNNELAIKLEKALEDRNTLLEVLNNVDHCLEDIDFPQNGFIRSFIKHALVKTTEEKL